MKVLIAYAGDAGTTENCANQLAKQLGEATLADLKKEMPDMSAYDFVIIGSNIHMGKFHVKAKEYIEKNKSVLTTKRYAFFISNGFPEQAEAFLIQNVEHSLLESAVCAASFGGELDLSKLKGMNKFVAKMVMNATKGDDTKIPKLLPENMKAFAETVQQAE